MFEFSAGSPALCLVDTIGDRTGAGVERLCDPSDLDRWLREASLTGAAIRPAAGADLAGARRLREATYRSVSALIEAARPDDADIEIINRMARAAPPRPQWRDGRVEFIADDPVAAALSLLAADAVALLAAPRAKRVRRCPDCAMIFLDRSPAGRRRWCSSASGCGNRDKVRQHRARRASRRKANPHD